MKQRLSNFYQTNQIILLKEVIVTSYEPNHVIANVEKFCSALHIVLYEKQRMYWITESSLQVMYSNNNISPLSIKKTCCWKHFVRSIECKKALRCCRVEIFFIAFYCGYNVDPLKWKKNYFRINFFIDRPSVHSSW